MYPTIVLLYLTLNLLSAIPLPNPDNFENLLDSLNTNSDDSINQNKKLEKIFDLGNQDNNGHEIAAALQIPDDKIFIGPNGMMEEQLIQHLQQEGGLLASDRDSDSDYQYNSNTGMQGNEDPFYGSDLYVELNNDQPVLVDDFLSSDEEHREHDMKNNVNYQNLLANDKSRDSEINPWEDLLNDVTDSRPSNKSKSSVDEIFGKLSESVDTRRLESDC